MAFTSVIVRRPDMMEPSYQSWGRFHSYAKVEALKDTEGVFYIDETAWLFDTRKSLPVLSRIIHTAHETQMPVIVFELHEKDIHSHIAAFPAIQRLNEFLGANR